MSTNDIIDDIDALIDEQLTAGETGQERRAATADHPCWHCGRAWHGLAITTRLEEMRREYQRRASEAYERGEEPEYATSAILDGYRYDQDDSYILCPGSEFIGPMPATMDLAGSGLFPVSWAFNWEEFGGSSAYSLSAYSPARVITPARWWRLDLPQLEPDDIWLSLIHI